MAGQYPEMDLPQGTMIVGVLPSFANTRNGQKQVFDVQCSNGQQYRTFNPGAGAQAQAALNNPNVTIRISVNGQYQNFEGVYPAGQAPPIQGGGFQAPNQGGFAPAPGQQQFTPAPGFVDAKQVEMRRVGGVQNATSALSAFVGSGYYLDDNGVLDIDKLTTDIVALAGNLSRYTVFGPKGEQEAAPVAETVPALPPGVTLEQLQAWANAQAGEGAVQVGAPTTAPSESEQY